MKLVNAISHRLLSGKRKIDVDLLTQHPQIFVYDSIKDEGTPSPLPKALQLGTRQIYVPDHATKLQMISAGLGWGRIAQSELKGDSALVAISQKICPTTHLNMSLKMSLMRSRNRGLGPIGREIWTVFEKRMR